MDRKPWHQVIFPKGRPLRWVLPVLLLLIIVLVQWQIPGWAERVEAWTVDARFRLRGAEQPRYPIIIVALDEDSFQMMNNLQGENIRTWSRANWAELVKKIAEGKPRLIALDVVFDTPGWDVGGDQALAQEIWTAGNIVLEGHMERRVDIYGGVQTSNFSYSEPLEVLSRAAIAVGVANFTPDVDGAFRRANLLWPWSNSSLPSFALVAATLYNGAPINVNRSDLGSDASILINFRGPESTASRTIFRTIPMHQVWSGEAPPETFRDAIVLVGFTTLIEQDRHPAPFAGKRGMPGVVIEANIVDTLLAGDWLHRPPTWLPMVLVVAAGLLGFSFANLRSPILGVLIFVSSLVVYLGIGVVLFTRGHYLLPLAAPVIVAIVVDGAAATERMIFAERDKRLLRRRFAGVMSPERLKAVLDNWEALMDTKRPEKEAAVLFADIRGFTHATATLTHQGRSSEMVRFLNAYLDTMAQAIFLEGGVVYRTFGDGLLILFGVPEPLPGHPLKAVRAAVRMALAANGLQALWPLREEGLFEMGIGINDGPMVDAIMGRGRRFDYTVLGDPVNAASRIESHCKVVMDIPRPPGGQVPETVTILLSEALYQKVGEHVIGDESIPPFEARGVAEPLRVVRLLGLKEGEAL